MTYLIAESILVELELATIAKNLAERHLETEGLSNDDWNMAASTYAQANARLMRAKSAHRIALNHAQFNADPRRNAA